MKQFGRRNRSITCCGRLRVSIQRSTTFCRIPCDAGHKIGQRCEGISLVVAEGVGESYAPSTGHVGAGCPHPPGRVCAAKRKFHRRTFRPPTPDEGVRGYTRNHETRLAHETRRWRSDNSPLKPKPGLNGAPGLRSGNCPTQAKAGLEWGTGALVDATASTIYALTEDGSVHALSHPPIRPLTTAKRRD